MERSALGGWTEIYSPDSPAGVDIRGVLPHGTGSQATGRSMASLELWLESLALERLERPRELR